MDLPKKFVEETKQAHLKYKKTNTVQSNVTYAIKGSNGNEIIRICDYIKEEYGDTVDRFMVNKELHAILGNMEELNRNELNLLVYDFLNQFFNKFKKTISQNYLWKLLDVYFHEMQHEIPSLTEQLYENLVRIVYSYIKFEIVIMQLRKANTPSKDSLRQLLECILYKRISRNDCHQIIYNKIGTFKYEFVKFEVKSLDEGAGLLGDHLTLEITIKHNETLHFFMKFVPKGNGPWDTLALNGFKNELFIYRDVIPQLEKFGAKDLVIFAPQCYLSRDNEVIVLENLIPLNFTFINISDSATYEWMMSSIKQLSRFHACSFVLEQKIIKEAGKEISIGDVYTKYFTELIYERNGLFANGRTLISSYYIKEAAERWTEMSVDQFEKKFLMAIEQVFEDVKKSEKYYNVICHGDIYGKNVLTNDRQESFLIDFQLIRYCPPALDFLFIIYISTSRNLRIQHMEHFIKSYYNFLYQYLKSHNVDLTHFYTWEKFCESINYYKSSAIIMVLLYLQIYLYPRELIKKYDNSPDKIAKYYHEERNQSYNEKIKNIIIDLYDIYKNYNHI